MAQIEAVIGGRHARRVGVPVQQVEGQRLLALQVVVDDVGPDQVVGAQEIEDGRHLAAVEIAALAISRSIAFDLLLVEKTFRSPACLKSTCEVRNVAALHPRVAGRRHVGEGRGEQRAADAVADGVDVALAGGRRWRRGP